MKTPPVTGRKVLFIGGPEAGNIRIIPESHGDVVTGDADTVYKIWPMRMQGDKRTIYFAYVANEHPINMLIDMWREYSPVAQIKRGQDTLSYNRVGQK